MTPRDGHMSPNGAPDALSSEHPGHGANIARLRLIHQWSNPGWHWSPGRDTRHRQGALATKMKGGPIFSPREEIIHWREEGKERDRDLRGQSRRGWASPG